ncbi:hypothetical protein PVAND_008440 [Polypedilum vanderplanki]|uniref:Ionotropic receptor n=1 Tax=Polypedilum vanderplanki TaxID=319348 RepID=A0A9J6CB34_POLVA|nr:hypothetical protein PVAND_008440 [Polypedilum vanderplanki]
MKLFRIFSLLLILISISHQVDSNQNLIIKNDSKLSKFICRLIFDLKRKNPNAKFVAIGTTMENDFEKNLIDKISYCLSKNEMAKMNFDFNKKFVDKIKAKSADLVILIADKIDIETLFEFIISDRKPFAAFDFMSKFLIVNSNSKSANSLATTMTDYHIFNFGILYEDVNDETTVFTTNLFFNTTEIHKRIKREEIIDRIYPDKLKNLNKYNYKVIVSVLKAYIDKSSGETFSKYLYFLEEISKIQNAKINLTLWPSTDSSLIISEIYKILADQNFDILLFDIAQIDIIDSRLNIYEENGICVIIPSTKTRPGNLNIFMSIFFKSHKNLVLVLISVILFIWKLYKKRGAKNSVSKVALFLWASSYDQSLNLRQNRLVLTFMLQLFVFSMVFRNFILNADFTSIMTVQSDQKYENVSEVIESNEKFIIECFVEYYLENTEEFLKINAEGRLQVEKNIEYISKDFGDRIIISQCNFVQTYAKMNNWSPDSYYLLPEKIYPHYSQFEVGILNPFKEKFQKYIDLSFESGLMQIWETFYILKTLGIKRKYFEKNDESILTWKEIRIAYFHIFGIGFTLAFFSFLCEILHFHIFRHWFGKICGILKRKILVKKERKVMKVKRINLGKKKTRNPRRLNVKRTKVYPANNQLFYLE